MPPLLKLHKRRLTLVNGREEVKNYKNRASLIPDDIEMQPDDPDVLAKYI